MLDSMTTNMNKVYTKYLSKPVGKDKGVYTVYHIFVEGKHRGIHQGYVGRSKLNIIGIKFRYWYEVKEAMSEKYSRKKRPVLTNINNHIKDIKIVSLASGLTLEEAKEMEKALRPNTGVWKNKFTWNVRKGG
jgi:hypothetical protein